MDAAQLKMNKTTILITGGAGFIGSNFVHYLYGKRDDIEVRVLDKLTYSGNLENLKAYENRPGFSFIQGDICDSHAVKKALQGVNIIVNFAAEVAVDRSMVDASSFLKTDVFGVYVLLEEAKNLKELKKFIQISTDEVYGHLTSGSFNEASELKPRNVYSASKLGGDRLAYSYFSMYNLPVIITRAANTYGPRAYLEKVIPLFITNLIDGDKVPIYGEGLQIRDWLYVEDHCRAIEMLIEKGVDGEVYNIASGQEYPNIDLTHKILKLMNKNESYIEFVKDRPGHDFRYSLDCSKLKDIGWEPEYDLTKGLDRTVRWYLNNEEWWRPVKERLDKRYITGFWGKT